MEEEMVYRFRRTDCHIRRATISVLDRTGAEIKFIQSCCDLYGYIATLGHGDTVVFKTGLGSFYWADKIEEKGSSCYIINPYNFRIIKDSWNKTDKQDSRDMVKALWVYAVTGEFGVSSGSHGRSCARIAPIVRVCPTLVASDCMRVTCTGKDRFDQKQNDTRAVYSSVALAPSHN